MYQRAVVKKNKNVSKSCGKKKNVSQLPLSLKKKPNISATKNAMSGIYNASYFEE